MESAATSGLRITEVRASPAGLADMDRGLVAYLELELNGCLLVKSTLRRTRAGRLALSFPCRRGRRGRQYTLVRPLDNAARLTIEAQVFEALGLCWEDAL